MQLLDRQIKWAVQYDGYGRLAGDHKSHEALGRLIDPAREEWRRAGRVPDWCGVDFLRGWAYFMVRVGRPALEPTGPGGPAPGRGSETTRIALAQMMTGSGPPSRRASPSSPHCCTC